MKLPRTLLLGLLFLGCAPGGNKPPDIVLITLDTTRADRIGAYGYERARTPVMDKLAAEGRLYTRAYSVQPLTIPAHGSIMTGRYPAEIGIRGNGNGRLEDDQVTMAEVLKEQGYQTHASVSAYVTSRVWGFEQGFDSFVDEWKTTGDTENFWSSSRVAKDVVDEVLVRYKQRNPYLPAFMWLHLYDAHYPYRPPAEFIEEGRLYDGEIAYVDAQVGRLVEALGTENTIFVLVADHGEGLGDHGELEHGQYVYDSTQHIPLIISGGGVKPEVIDEVTSLVDVLPTLLTVLGKPIPATVTGRAVPGTEARPVHMEAFYLEERYGLEPHVGIVDGANKYIEAPRPEVYDLLKDPGELTDLAAADPALSAALQAKLEAFGFEPPGTREELPADLSDQLMALGYMETFGEVELEGSKDHKDHRRLLGLSQRAMNLRREGKLEESVDTLITLVGEYPTVPELRMRLVRGLQALGRTEEADAQTLELARVAPDHMMGRFAKAHQLLREGESDEAVVLLRAIAEERNFDPSIRGQVVRTMLTYPSTREQALSQARGWLEEYPDDDLLAGILGIELSRRMDLQAAAPLLIQGLQAGKPEPGTAFHLARLYLMTGKYEDALRAIDIELKANPDYPDAAPLRVEVLARLERWEEVLADGAPLADQEKVSRTTLHGLAQAAFNLKKYDQARTYLDRALAMKDPDPLLMTLDANLMLKEGKPKAEAQARFEAAQAKLKKGIEELKAGLEHQGRGVEGSASTIVVGQGSDAADAP